MFAFDVPLKLLRQIARFARNDLIDKLVGLGLSPDLPRKLAFKASPPLGRSPGRKRATRRGLRKLLNGFGDHAAVHHEDPAEDVFVSAVSSPTGRFRIFNGIYPGADYSLQRLLDAVLVQDFEYRDLVARRCNALLRVSDTVAERCGFRINEFAESRQWRTDWRLRLPVLLIRGAAARFTRDDLTQLGIEIEDLIPFQLITLDGLLEASFGGTYLNRWPVIIESDSLHLPIPSFVSAALRLYLAHAIASGVVPQKAIEKFHADQFALWMGVDLPMRKAKWVEMAPLHLPEPELDIPGLIHTVLRFDEDKLVHILVLECVWRDPPKYNVHDAQEVPAKLQKDLADYLRVVCDKLSNDMGIGRGFTRTRRDGALLWHCPRTSQSTGIASAFPPGLSLSCSPIPHFR